MFKGSQEQSFLVTVLKILTYVHDPWSAQDESTSNEKCTPVGHLGSWCDIFEMYNSSREWDDGGGVGWTSVLSFFLVLKKSILTKPLK